MSQATPSATQADALLRAGRFAEAAAAFKRLTAASPGNLSYQRAYAAALGRSGRPNDARAVLRRALRIAPRNHELLCELAMIDLLLEDLPGADESSSRALMARGSDPNVRMVRAMALRALGRYDEAYEMVAPSVLQGSVHAPSVQVFMELCLWRNDPGPGIDAARRALDAGRSAGAFNERRVRLAYAQLLERDGQYDRAFEQYDAVNRMNGGASGFDPDRFDALVEQVRAAWTPDAIAAIVPQTPPAQADLPVFLVGMPRSGSSLVERVLDRHPDVTAGGELPAMHEAVVEAVPEVAAPANAARLPLVPDPALFNQRRAERLRRSYLKAARRLAGRSARVTDKSLGNFLHLGPIRAALPTASVIHCVRDPLDTCASCYFQDFNSQTPFTQDLRVLGRFYNAYRRLMDHWAEVAPPPPTEAVYERVVDDLPTEAQHLVEAIDLPWDDRCAKPHEGEGYTATASRDQVRRKVYRSSVGRWKRFEKHLGPLIDAIDDRYLE